MLGLALVHEAGLVVGEVGDGGAVFEGLEALLEGGGGRPVTLHRAAAPNAGARGESAIGCVPGRRPAPERRSALPVLRVPP
jgi:hypothetical protein